MNIKAMFYKQIFNILLTATLLLSVSTGCGDDSAQLIDFEQKEMLENYATRLIKPAFAGLDAQMSSLKLAWVTFQACPTPTHLQAVQSAWLQAFLAWQRANAFNFGPAGEEGLNKALIDEIGVFPVDTAQIETYITNADASLANANRDTRGFLAIEYLLFSNSPENLLIRLQETNRKAYLTAIIEQIRGKVQIISTNWETYDQEFVENEGTSVGSSVSLLYNEFVRSYETIKNYKIGLPAGKLAGQTAPAPDLVECLYSDHSLAALAAHLQAIEDIYYGTGANGEQGLGFYEYLQAVEGGQQLTATTEAQWANVENALENIPTTTTFYELMANEDPTITSLHTELQKQTRFFKSDMSSLLGIAITFSSNDGD